MPRGKSKPKTKVVFLNSPATAADTMLTLDASNVVPNAVVAKPLGETGEINVMLNNPSGVILFNRPVRGIRVKLDCENLLPSEVSATCNGEAATFVSTVPGHCHSDNLYFEGVVTDLLVTIQQLKPSAAVHVNYGTEGPAGNVVIDIQQIQPAIIVQFWPVL